MTKFVSGIKEEIRSVIALHRPNSVDTASALALIQEEELDLAKQKGNQRDYNKSFSRSSYTGEKTKSVLQDKTKGPTESTTGESKLDNLKAFRRKNGLCFKCGEKWGQNHKCPAQIPLHVLEELFDAIEMDEQSEEENSEQMETPPEAVFALQPTPSAKKDKRRTMKIMAKIGKQQVLVLIDSGSVGTFVSGGQIKPQNSTMP